MNPKLKSVLAKVFALVGMIALWAPILFMFLTAIVGSIISKTFLFDYFLLAETSLVIVPGLVLLFFASLLAEKYSKWFGWGGALAIVLLVGSQALAFATGLSTGAVPASGPIFITVIAAIVLFNILVIALAVLSILLVKKLFRRQPEAIPTAE